MPCHPQLRCLRILPEPTILYHGGESFARWRDADCLGPTDHMSDQGKVTDEAVSPEHAYRQYRILKIGVLALLVMGCAIPLAMNLVDPDLWGHWQYGRDWIADGELPQTATHTYAAPNHRWINHENAAELLLAVGFERLGVHALLVVKCLIGLAILATMVWTARRRQVHALAAWALMLLVANNLQAFFPMRPQLLSFAILTAAMLCLDRAFPRWPDEKTIRYAWLWALPPLFALWVNSHGGFVAGLCVVGAVLCGRICELLASDRKHLGAPLHLAVIGLACVAATLINPYGLDMHRWLLGSLGSPRPEITEWAPPLPGKPVFWPFVTLSVVAAASLIATRRRRDWTQIAILLLVGWQASMHLRHIAFFALLCGFWLPSHLQSALKRLRPDRSEPLPTVLPARWLRMAMAAAILFGIGCQGFALASRLRDFPVQQERFPVGAIQFMADRGLQGKLVVAFNWAQYAIAALSPDVTVGFDGRFRTCYPQDVVDMHFDFLLGEHEGQRFRSEASGPVDGAKVLQFGHPDMVLVDPEYPNAVRIMQEQAAQPQPDWVLLYRDPQAELWGRRARYDDPTSEHYLPEALRQLAAQPTTANPQWPALPSRDRQTDPPRAARGGR